MSKNCNALLAILLCVSSPVFLTAAVSIDSNGWTVVTPSTDSRIVYVSSSQGNNSNNGLSPSTPKRTIAAGDALIRDGYPDHLLLKRGDVFPSETTGNLLGRWKNGRSASEPMVFSYYGDSGPRPVVKIKGGFVSHSGSVRNYQAFIGVELYKSNSDPSSPDFTNAGGSEGIRLVGGGNNILIEDCVIRFMMTTVQSYNGTYRNFSFRRNIILDAWGHGSSLGHDGRIQGIYLAGVDDGYIIEENFFDHNGWSPVVANAGANMYNHNIYLQYTNVEGGIIRGNIIARGASHGLQARSGGIVEKNLFVLNAIGASTGGVASPTVPEVFTFDNRVSSNVVINGRLMDPANTSYPRTPALWGIDTPNLLPDVLVEDNIVSQRIHSGVNSAYNQIGYSDHEPDNISYEWSASQDTDNPAWLNPDRDLGDFFASIGQSNNTISYLAWLRTRPIRTLPWEMTAYSAINYIRAGFNKSSISGYYTYPGSSMVSVTGVAVTPGSASLSGIGATTQLSAAVSPSNATNPAVTWSSSNSSVATVDNSGLVTAVSAGTASITATTVDGSYTSSSNITVQNVSVSGVSISNSSLTLYAGQGQQLTAAISPANATNQTVSWSTTNSSVATVSSSGMVNAVAPGSATITVTTNDGSYTANSSITVSTAPETPVNLALSQPVNASFWQDDDDATLPPENLVDGNTSDSTRWSAAGFSQWAEIDLGNTYDLTEIRVYPFQSRNYQYTVSASADGNNYTMIVDRSANTESASVLSNTVCAHARYVLIEITGAYSYSGTWVSINELQVYGFESSAGIPVTGITVTPSALTITEGQLASLTAAIIPGNATNPSVNWSSSDPDVASVDPTGMVSAHAPGSATITATTADGSFTDNTAITVEAISSGGNVAESKSVTASAWQDDSEGYNPPARLTDGDTGNSMRWSAMNFPQWAVIDLGNQYNLNTFRVYPYLNRDYQYIIEVSADGTNYTTAVDRSSNTTGSTVITDTASATGRYVRLTVTDAHSYAGSWVSINELEADGTLAPAFIPVTDVTVVPSTVILDIGDNIQLATTVSPANATDDGVTYISSDDDVATVSATGLVNAVAAGNATITVTTDDGDFTASASVTVAAPAVPQNVATGAAVTVSSHDSLTIGSNLVDGNTSTDEGSRWSAFSFPQYAILDLGNTYQISQFRLYPYQDRDYRYEIEVSTNGTTYTQVTDRTANTEAAAVLTDNISLTTARYVRLTVTGAATYTGQWVSFGEFEVYAVPVGTSWVTGAITRDYWTGISGQQLSSLVNHASYPYSPTGSDTLSSFRAVDWNNSATTSNWSNDYGQRIYGYLHPPVSGNYTFWISSDDYSALYLSTGSSPANVVKIAEVAGYTTPLQWNKYSSQKSVTISLSADQVYYIEAIHKEGTASDNLAVGWAKPGESTSAPSEIIPGSALSPWLSGE